MAAPAALERAKRLERIWKEPSGIVGWITTVDHKRIGILYLFTALIFFALGGAEALMIRTQLIKPPIGNGFTRNFTSCSIRKCRMMGSVA